MVHGLQLVNPVPQTKEIILFFCKTAEEKQLITLSKNSELAFAKDGFQNWKKAIKSFKEHERSQSHNEAIYKVNAANKSDESVQQQLSKQNRAEQQQRRSALLCQISTLIFLLRQGLPIRGHIETESNFIQLLRLRGNEIPEIKLWLAAGRYLSPEIVNEQITLIRKDVLIRLLNDVKEARWFAVMADETMDVAYKEQLVVAVRWVDKEYEIHEDMLGLLEITSQTSSYLTAAIKDVLLRCGLSLELCRGQAYDGAPNMSGHLTGVVKQIQDQYPSAIGVHCLAHNINLAIQDVTKKCRPVRDSMDLVLEVEKLICLSPKRSHLFLQKKSQQDSPPSPNLRPICPTRWTVRTYAIDAVLKNYNALQETMDEIHSTSNNEYSRRAGGQLALMEKFSTYFGLKLSYLIFSASEQFSVSIQGKDTSIQNAYEASNATCRYFERQRKETSFDTFYDVVCEEAKDLAEEPKFPRYRQAPRKLDDGSAAHRFQTPKEYYRQQYFEALELAQGGLESRFQQRNMETVRSLESLLLKAANGEFTALPAALSDLYKNDISAEKLSIQLKMLPDIFTEDEGVKIKKVTSIGTICQFMEKSELTKKLLSEVDKLLRLYITIPVTTATAERAFSSLRRIKTYLRSTMTQQRLNNCMLTFVHKSLTDMVSNTHIAKQFVGKDSHREAFFGKY